MMKLLDDNDLKKRFITAYGGNTGDIRVFFAPGRVNLIGEHTDYNNGYVMPFGLQYGTYLLTRLTSDPLLAFRSENFAGNAEVCLKKGISKVGDSWINYPLGVVREFVLKGIEPQGIQMLFSGDIPNEAGLSSSASIEMVTAIAMNELFKAGIDRIELVKMGQRAENNFVGMNCGIMDQFAVTMGQKDHAVFLDCGTLEHSIVPFDLGDHVIMIVNTNKKRGLSGSKYNERRSECDQAVKFLSKVKPIGSLSDLTLDEFEEIAHLISDPVVLKRARHVISENHRVLAAMDALGRNDLSALGRLMEHSHASLRDDYEVSCKELDAVVELAAGVDGVMGSRMTGAGFGGCAISLVHREAVTAFSVKVDKEYTQRTGLKASFYLAEPGDGARELKSV